MLKNDRLLRAIWRKPVDTTPVWIMRQAGRYLPEYRKLRAEAGSFMRLCKTPELACQVTLQPLMRFDLDAAILFSDILTIPDAMGLGLNFVEGEGPTFAKPIRSVRDISALPIINPEKDLHYVLETIRLIQQELAGKVPLIGFCGSPWTLATYMVEGKANKTFPAIHAMMSEQPEALHSLLDKLAQAVTSHLNAQINAGVQVVMIFDTWGGMLDKARYQEYSLRYIHQVISGLATNFSPTLRPSWPLSSSLRPSLSLSSIRPSLPPSSLRPSLRGSEATVATQSGFTDSRGFWIAADATHPRNDGRREEGGNDGQREEGGNDGRQREKGGNDGRREEGDNDVQRVTETVPVILFTKGGGEWLDVMAESGCDVIGVDWLVNLSSARQQVGNKVALQGNMDPQILQKTPDEIRVEVARILAEYGSGSGSGHIFNLGHGITPDISPENVAVLVDAVHSLSRAYHS